MVPLACILPSLRAPAEAHGSDSRNVSEEESQGEKERRETEKRVGLLIRPRDQRARAISEKEIKVALHGPASARGPGEGMRARALS